ncbi:hypothetical protein Ate01nite_39610 [Actinoplanes teichomyceticus]|nr:hypothetical protein Ate01nite_39610 [Actinoplanes teichomyceticus]
MPEELGRRLAFVDLGRSRHRLCHALTACQGQPGRSGARACGFRGVIPDRVVSYPDILASHRAAATPFRANPGAVCAP